MVLCHANGLHGLIWSRLWIDEFVRRNLSVYSITFSGFGDVADVSEPSWELWEHDLRRCISEIQFENPRVSRLFAFGISMGGTAILRTCAKSKCFVAVSVYEPIVFEDSSFKERSPGPNLLALGARRRRTCFASYEEAILNFSAKFPMKNWNLEMVN